MADDNRTTGGKPGERPEWAGWEMPHLHNDGGDDSYGIFIVVEANIGAGKTEFVGILARMREQYSGRKARPLFEPVGDPRFLRMLGDYYRDPKRWGMTFQMHVLQERFRQHTLAAELAANGVDVVQDRSIYADGCFGMLVREDGNMTDDEWSVYARTFGAMKRYLRYPDVLVYLRTDPKTCYDRMKRRARDEEASVPLDYLKRLHDKHEAFVSEMERYTRVVRVDYDHFGAEIEEVNRRVDACVNEDRRFMRDWRRL